MTRGVLLGFSHPEDLAALRQQNNFRIHIQQVVSPRHVLVDEKQARSFLKMLERCGVHLQMFE